MDDGNFVEDWLLDLVDSDAPSIAAVATVLLHEAAPAECGATLNALMVEDVDEQAQMLVDEMAMAGCTAFEVDAAAIVAGLASCKSLHTLILYDCGSLTALPDVSKLKELKTFIKPLHLDDDNESGSDNSDY